MEPYKDKQTLEDMPNLQKVCAFLEAYELARNCNDVTEVCRIIQEHHLDWQHINSRMLTERKVWEALLDHVPIEALLRNLSKLTCLGLFDEEKHVETVILRLGKITTLHPSDIEDEETGSERTYAIHPFKVLLAHTTYKKGSTTRPKIKWVPNERILDALSNAFHNCFRSMTPIGKKYCLAIDVGETMKHSIMGVKDINCYTAAALMILTIIKVESRFNVFTFSGDDYSQWNIDAKYDIKTIVKEMKNIPKYTGIDCSLPIKKIIEKDVKDYDVFCIYTCNDTYCGNVHAAEALRQYREYSGNKDVKLVVCAMNSKSFTIADPQDDGMLDVVGFDAATPEIIAKFCQ